MSFFKRLHQRFIQWVTFDPEDPYCDADPRTGKRLTGRPADTFHKKFCDFMDLPEEEQNKYPDEITRYYCSRLYYILNPYKEKQS